MGRVEPYFATITPKTPLITPETDIVGYNFTFTESLSERIERSIKNLTAKDDHVSVMGSEVSTLLLITISGITSTVIILLVFNFANIVTLMRTALAKIRCICHRKSTELTIKYQVSRDEVEEAKNFNIQE